MTVSDSPRGDLFEMDAFGCNVHPIGSLPRSSKSIFAFFDALDFHKIYTIKRRFTSILKNTMVLHLFLNF